jgi:2-methylcitrate dehydratase PrpD
MAQAFERPLPEEVTELVKQHVLDKFGAMSGSNLLPGVDALKFVRANESQGCSTIAASDLRCGSMEAAFCNGMLAHSDETDDSHSPSLSHPGCGTVPAALATGEQLSKTGLRFLRAVALGYDMGPRITMTLGAVHYQTNSHRSFHAISGTFAAASAAGSCAQLNAQRMRWLLDYTAQQASGIAAWQSDTEHVEKAFVFGAMPARAGVTAAQLVSAGWTGVDDVFSGPDNFFAAFAPQAQPEGIIDQLGQRYEIKRTNIKKWSVGSPIQAPVDALSLLIQKHNLHAEQVQLISVHLAGQEALVVNDRAMPDVSLQHLMAVLFMDGTVSFEAAHEKHRMSDPATLKQRSKVRLIADPELDKLLPQRVAEVDVMLTDGSSLHQRVENVRGTFENPMTWEEIIDKSRDLVAPVLGTAQFAKLLEKVRSIEKCADLREVGSLLQK